MRWWRRWGRGDYRRESWIVGLLGGLAAAGLLALASTGEVGGVIVIITLAAALVWSLS